MSHRPASYPLPAPSYQHVYVHVPFCARRCTYCDFAIAVRSEVPVDEYLEALGRELRMSPPFGPLETLYLGGGTPSRLGGEGIARLLAMFSPDIPEVTMEANPEDVTPQAVHEWVAAGVNRLSLGVQSFADAVLHWMHRTHDSRAVYDAVRAARDGGLTNISLDLIFALPDDMRRDFAADLDAIIALAPEHVSLYGLTVEPRTPLDRQIARGQTRPAGDARWEEEYLLAHEKLTGAGYRFYEVSNASLPGRESRHNSAYWKQVPYLGLGPSSHSFDGRARWWNEAAYRAWVDRLLKGDSPVAGREELTDSDTSLERLYLRLRTSDGLSVMMLPEPARQSAAQWVRQGWARQEGSGEEARIVLNPTGWLRLDELVASV